MNKVICAALSLISFVLGFILFGYITVKWGQNTDKWGDLATWTGSGVAFLALIAAVLAAVWSKRSSDRQNENATILELAARIETRADIINNCFEKIIEYSDDIFRRIYRGEHEATKEELWQYFYDCWFCVNTESTKISKILYRTVFLINSSRISEDLKLQMKSDLLESLDMGFVYDCLTRGRLSLFFSYDPSSPEKEKLYYGHMREILTIASETGSYSDLVSEARKRGFLD